MDQSTLIANYFTYASSKPIDSIEKFVITHYIDDYNLSKK